MRLSMLIGLALAASIAAGPAIAQTAAPTDDPSAAASGARPKSNKATGPRPAQSVTVTNASANTATEVVITGEEKTAKISKPLKSKAKAVVKLPKLKGCTVAVAATFEGEGQVDAGEFDICKEKTIRFTD